MRIVSGSEGGRRIAVPPGRDVRPTSERVREALFSALAGRIAGASVLDLFAGSGALGLEALSRGARDAVFCESAPRVMAVLRANVEALHGDDGRCRLLSGDGLRSLDRLAREGKTFDLVFLDPPYASDLLERGLMRLATGDLLADGGLAVAEHPAGRPPPIPAGLRGAPPRRYGDTALTLVERDSAGD